VHSLLLGRDDSESSAWSREYAERSTEHVLLRTFQVIAMFNSTAMRLIGIGIAAFSSGLGELTFLQWSTVLPTASLSGTAVGGWSSGTGAAGLVGAGLWWGLRNLGVRLGLGLASILPLGFPAVLNLLLPPFESLGKLEVDHYEPIFAADDDASEVSIPQESEDYGAHNSRKLDLPTEVILTTQEKIELVKPLVMRYMFWLFAVYVFEYVINSVCRSSSSF
jgi:battenin